MTKIAVFVGSLQKKSFNGYLAKTLESLAPSDMEFQYIDIDLPLFNQDLEDNFPAKAQAMKDIIMAADGVLFVTPEYNRSVPGVMKNAIDWASRPFGENAFVRKPMGVVGASSSSMGTAFAQSDLRHIAAFLDMKQLGQPEIYISNAGDVFDSNGELIDERWRKNLNKYIVTFADWVESEKE